MSEELQARGLLKKGQVVSQFEYLSIAKLQTQLKKLAGNLTAIANYRIALE
jgi:hypothetical protein